MGHRRIAADANRRFLKRGLVPLEWSSVYRILKRNGFYQRTRKPRREIPRPPEPRQRFAMDFTEKAAPWGRVYALQLIDEFNSEVYALDAYRHPTAWAVKRSLGPFVRQFADSGAVIRCDHGRQFIDESVQMFCARYGIALDYVPPPKRGFIERNNRSVKEECLNIHVLQDPRQVQALLDAHRWKFNHRRPMTALSGRTPVEFRRSFWNEGKR